MACFIAPAAEAVITTTATKLTEEKEKKEVSHITLEDECKTPFSQKLKWLDYMLWGGSALLLLEHIWHGEITLSFPFFTAAAEPGGWSVILHEMGTVGVAMSVIVTLVWAGMVAWSTIHEKKTGKTYVQEKDSSILSLIYAGTLLMCLIDGIFSYAEMGSAFFHPSSAVLTSNICLWLVMAALGFGIWRVILLAKNRR